MGRPTIAIIGAGPGGLTLARLLQKNRIACTIYEAEHSRSVRNQGGTLDLHPKAGQRALQEAGLLDEFKRFSRPEGEAMKIVKYDGAVLWDENVMGNVREDSGDRPEIDREDLRNILLDSLLPGTIKWGKKLNRVEPDPKAKDKHILFFDDVTVEMGVDLVVGADGAWSKVRPLLTDEKPYYSGISAIELWSLDVEKKNPWLSEYVGKGNCFMFDEGRALLSQRNGNGSVRAYASVRKPETWVEDCGIDWTDHAAARQAIVTNHFNDCGEDIKKIILESDDELIPRKLYMLPVGIKWDSKPGVTLIGDSAHLMTPFAGVGVNVAMADALELARALISQKDSIVAKAFSDSHNIATAIKEYEASMFPRAKENAEKTYRGLVGHFSGSGGEEFASKFRKYYEMRKAAQQEKEA